MSIKEKPPDDFFKGIKISLKSILKHPDINTPKITNAVILCNKIIINVLLFMKLYLLNYYETHNAIPVYQELKSNIKDTVKDIPSEILYRIFQGSYERDEKYKRKSSRKTHRKKKLYQE